MSTEILDNSQPDAPQGEMAPCELAPAAPPPAARAAPTAAIPMVAAFGLALACAEPSLAAAKVSSFIGPLVLVALLAGFALAGDARFKWQKALSALALAASLGALAWLALNAWSSWESLASAGRAQAVAEMLRRFFWALPVWAGLLAVGSTRQWFALWMLLCSLGAAAIALGIRAPFF